jgi:hypothetical protein
MMGVPWYLWLVLIVGLVYVGMTSDAAEYSNTRMIRIHQGYDAYTNLVKEEESYEHGE